MRVFCGCSEISSSAYWFLNLLFQACVWDALPHRSWVFFFYKFISSVSVVLLQCQLELSSSSRSQHSTLETLWVGSSCMQGTLLATCCWLSHPLNLFSSFSVPSLQFSIILVFSLHSSCGGGNIEGVYIFWFGVDPYTSLAAFPTSVTVA